MDQDCHFQSTDQVSSRAHEQAQVEQRNLLYSQSEQGSRRSSSIGVKEVASASYSLSRSVKCEKSTSTIEGQRATGVSPTAPSILEAARAETQSHTAVHDDRTHASDRLHRDANTGAVRTGYRTDIDHWLDFDDVAAVNAGAEQPTSRFSSFSTIAREMPSTACRREDKPDHAANTTTLNQKMAAQDIPEQATPANIDEVERLESDSDSEFPFDERRTAVLKQRLEADLSNCVEDERAAYLQNALNYRRDRLLSAQLNDITLNEWSADESSNNLNAIENTAVPCQPLFVVNSSAAPPAIPSSPDLSDRRRVLGELNSNVQPVETASNSQFSAIGQSSPTDFVQNELLTRSPTKPTKRTQKGMTRIKRQENVPFGRRNHVRLFSRYANRSPLDVKTAIQDFEDKIMRNKSRAACDQRLGRTTSGQLPSPIGMPGSSH